MVVGYSANISLEQKRSLHDNTNHAFLQVSFPSRNSANSRARAWRCSPDGASLSSWAYETLHTGCRGTLPPWPPICFCTSCTTGRSGLECWR